jgi:hypothetical protein
LTATSDCHYAREMLLRVARESIGEYLIEAQISWKVISDNYKIVNPPLEPIVTLAVNNGSLEFGLSYVVDYTKRTAKQDELFSKIVQEVSNSNGRLQWASSSISATVNLLPTGGAALQPASGPLANISGAPASNPLGTPPTTQATSRSANSD